MLYARSSFGPQSLPDLGERKRVAMIVRSRRRLYKKNDYLLCCGCLRETRRRSISINQARQKPGRKQIKYIILVPRQWLADLSGTEDRFAVGAKTGRVHGIEA